MFTYNILQYATQFGKEKVLGPGVGLHITDLLKVGWQLETYVSSCAQFQKERLMKI